MFSSFVLINRYCVKCENCTGSSPLKSFRENIVCCSEPSQYQSMLICSGLLPDISIPRSIISASCFLQKFTLKIIDYLMIPFILFSSLPFYSVVVKLTTMPLCIIFEVALSQDILETTKYFQKSVSN